MTRPLSNALNGLKKALSDGLPANKLNPLVNTVCAITEDLINSRAEEELGFDVASFFDHNGVLYMLQHCEINVSIKKRLLNCFKIILKLQCPYLECYTNEIWTFFNNYLYATKDEEFDENLYFDICNALPNSRCEIIQNFNLFIHQILPTFYDRRIEKMKILCTLLKCFPEKNSMNKEDTGFIFAMLISQDNWSKDTVHFILTSLHLLKGNSFYHSLFNSQLKHIFNQMTEWLEAEKIFNRQIADSWTLFIKDNFKKFNTHIFGNTRWFTQMERIVNSPNENIKFSLKAQCAQQYFKCLLKQDNDDQLLCYYKMFLKEFENKQVPLRLFSVHFFKLFIPWKYDTIPPEDQVIFNDMLINHLYWRFGSDEYSFPLGDYLELMSLFFLKCRNSFHANSFFYKNILFQTIMLYPKSDCKEELGNNIIASLYIFDQLSGNIDSIVHGCIIKQCSHKWVGNYEQEKKKIQFNTYHQYVSFWIHIMCFQCENTTIEIPQKDRDIFCQKLLSSFIKLLEQGFEMSLESDFTKSQNSQEFTESTIISTYNVNVTIFENFSVLFCCVVNEICEKIPVPVIADLFNKVTSMSRRNPDIYGLYAITATCLNIMKKHSYILNFELSNDLFNINQITFEYFNHLFQNGKTFDEKLLETLETIISIPVKLVPYFSPELLIFFKNIFYNHFYGSEPVYKSLNAIHSWITILGLGQLENFLRDLIPSFRKFIFQLESDVDDKIFKHTSNSYNCIIKLLALFPQNLCCHLFDQDPLAEVQSSYRLSLHVPSKKLMGLSFQIDCIIPRVILLVSETANGKLKQSSCELLHSLCVFCLGTSSQLDLLHSTNFKILLNSIIETMISTSYRSDGVVYEMFKCLLFEICHLFATRLHYYSNFASSFIDIILRGLSNEVTSGAKKLSMKCMKEFITWTSKSENNDIILNNSRELVTKQICYYFLHGRTNRRRGAAIAFNCIAETVLKERDYVNKYSIYIIFYMITSLETYDEKNNEMRTFLELLQIAVVDFFEPDSFRERLHPEGIEDTTMQCLLKWLLGKCTSYSYECRNSCIKLINLFSDHYKDAIDISHLFSDNDKTYLSQFMKIIDMEPPRQGDDLLKWLSTLNIVLEYLEFHLSKVGSNPPLLELISKSIHGFFGVLDNLEGHDDFACNIPNEMVNKNKMKHLWYKRSITSNIARIFANDSNLLEITVNSNPSSLINFICMYFTCPLKVGYFGHHAHLELANIVKIVQNLSIVKSTLLNQLVQKYNETVDLVLNTLQSYSCPTQEYFDLLSKLEFLFRETNKYDIIKAWKWSPLRIMNYLKQLVINGKIKSNQINYQARKLLSKILDFSISLTPQNTSWFWNLFCFNEGSMLENYWLMTEFDFFLIFKDVFCSYIVQNFDESSVGNLNSAKLVIIKEVLEWANKDQPCNTIGIGNAVLKYFIKQWRDTEKWLEMHSSKKNDILDFLYVLVKTMHVCFYGKSKLGNWIWSEFDFTNINYIKLLPYVVSSSSYLLITKLKNSSCTETLFQEKLWNGFKCSANTSLIAFIISNTLKEKGEAHFSTHDISNMLSRMPKETENTLICDSYNAILWNDGDLEKRLHLLKNIFVPLCYKAGLESITRFYVEKLKELNTIISTDIIQSVAPPNEEEKSLISKKTIAFIILETMFGVLKIEYVLKCIKQGFKTDNARNLVKQMLLRAYNIRKCKPHELGGKTYCEYWRSLQCAAFNCTAAIICNTKNGSGDEMFYAKFIFKEDRDKWMIWDNITYKQDDVAFVSFEERKRSAKIKVSTSLQYKDKLKLEENIYDKVGSSSFSLSTFSQDCKTFDFVGSTDIPAMNRECSYQEFQFKKDQFNEHECMGILCGVLHQMINIGVIKKNDPSMPVWISSLLNSFTFPTLRVYGKLLILKMILNTREIFKPYAQYWLLPIIVTANSIIPPLPNQKLNYMLSDIVVMLLSWRDAALPKPTFQIWVLIEKIISSSPPNMDKPELKQNMYLITEIMIHWGSSIIKPKLDSLRQLITSKDLRHNKMGLQIFQLLLKHGVQVSSSVSEETNFDEFMQLIDNVDQDIFILSAEILGLLLRLSVSEESRMERQIKLVDVLSRMHIKHKAKFFVIFYHIQLHYPQLCHMFISHIITNLKHQCYNDTYIKSLNILNSFLAEGPNLDKNVFQQLKDCFTSINNEDQKVLCPMLQVTLTCFQKYTDFSHLLSFENLKVLIAQQSLNEETRGKLCDVLVSMYERYHVPNSREESECMKEIEAYLFVKLFDESAQIQSKMLQFWVKAGVLPPDVEKAVLFLLEYALKVSYQKNLLGILINVLIKYLEQFVNFSEQVFQFALIDYNNGQICQIYNKPYKVNEGEILHAPKFVISTDDLSVYNKCQKDKKGSTCENLERQYRYYHGDYPYTKIALIDILKPLSSLALFDENFAQKLFLALANGICELIKKDLSRWADFKTNFTALFNIIDRKQPTVKHKIYHVMLEIAISNDICFNFNNTITDMCISNRLEELGILFAENCIVNDNREEVYEESSSKRIKLDPSCIKDEEPYISTIIRLYLSINEDDVATDIFDDYVSKEEIYRNQSQQYLSSLFKLKKCYALFDWESLDKLLFPEGESCSSFWNSHDLISRKTDIFPFIVKSTVQQAITGRCDAQLLKLEKLTPFMEDFGAELSLLYLLKEDVTNLRLSAQLSLRNHINNFKREFSDVKFFSIHGYILKLKSLIDLYMLSRAENFYLTHFVDEYCDVRLKFYGNLLNYVDYRAFCREILHINGFNCTSVNSREWAIEMIDFAVSKHKFYMARKYLVKLHKKLDDNMETPVNKIINQIKLGEVGLLKVQMINEPTLKLESLKTNWKGLSELIALVNENADCFSERKTIQIINRYIAVLCAELIELNSEYDFTENISEIERTIQSISPNAVRVSGHFTFNNLGEKELLFQFGLQCLINTAEYDEGINAGKAYMSVAMFCKKYFTRFAYREQNIEIFIAQCILRSMKLGCEQARQLLPLIFTYKNVFIEENCLEELYQVPKWMVFKWLPQLFVKLTESSSKVLLPLLKKLFKIYPYSASISFIMWNDVFGDDDNNKNYFKTLSTVSPDCLLMTKRIINGLNQLCHPTILLRSYLKKLLDAYKTNRSVVAIYSEIYAKCFYTTGNQMVGKIYEINKPHFDFVQRIQNEKQNYNECCFQLQMKIAELHQNIPKIDETRLDQFCPWLANFTPHIGSFDIPWGYVAPSDTHKNPPKLLGFATTIQLISSLRHPIKATMLGSDGKYYKWLVKFGEDLRSDQRVQQLFDCMNHSFKNVSETLDCKLNIYQVIPLKHNFGLIEWMNNATTMSDFINKSLTIEEIQLRNDIRNCHEKWILACDAENYCRAHNIAVQQYTKTEVENHFQMKCQKLPSKLIKKSLTRMSMSAYDYYKFRMRFLKTYSVLSVCHWILGIGDRHLKNILITSSHCEIIGIDYNYAFDIGLRFLPIPELVPFRLTPQFYDLFLPLGKSGILHQTMISVIDSIETEAILSITKLFSEEPKFLEYIIRKCSLHENLNKDLPLFLNDIFHVIDGKLKKENPVLLMENHLKRGFLPQHVADVYGKLIKAEFGEYAVKSVSISKALVNCLVDISTNKRILGLSLPAFEPWI